MTKRKEESRYHQGKFSPKFPKKYNGDPTQIFYRSGWELKAMRNLDLNSNVLEWSSETTIVWYTSPIDNKRHRYFPDFVATVRSKDDSIKTYMIEVKPLAQTKEPNIPKKKTKRFLYEVTTWGVNSAKWNAAREFCADRGWEFLILTEKHLGLDR